MKSVRQTFEASPGNNARPQRRNFLARLAIAGTLGLTLCFGAAAVGIVSPSSASGGPGTVQMTHPLDSASGGPGTVYFVSPASASGGPGTV